MPTKRYASEAHAQRAARAEHDRDGVLHDIWSTYSCEQRRQVYVAVPHGYRNRPAREAAAFVGAAGLGTYRLHQTMTPDGTAFQPA